MKIPWNLPKFNSGAPEIATPKNWAPNSHGRPPLLGSRTTCRKRTLQWHRSLEWSSFSFSFTLFLCFPLFPLNLLPLPCLQYSFPSSCSFFCCLCCRCSCSCGFQPSDGHHFGELSWRVSHPMTLPLAAALVARTPLTPFTPFSVQAKQLQNACKKCQWDGTWHKDP